MLDHLRNLHQFGPTKRPKWSAMTDDRPPFATLEGKTVMNKCESDDSDILRDLYSV